MLICSRCGGHAVYLFSEKKFLCRNCKHTEDAIPAVQTCPHCHKPYIAHAWFDPSGCPNCNTSFVE